MTCADYLGKSIPNRGNSKYKDPEMGVCLAFKNSKEVIVARMGKVIGMKSKRDVKRLSNGVRCETIRGFEQNSDKVT